MRMKSLMIPVVLSALMVTAAFPVAFASHSTPFNGTMSGSGIATSVTTNAITASVHLEHLGKSVLVGTTTVTGRSECGGFVGTEVDAIRSANGDEVFISGDGVSCPVSVSPLVFQDTVTFTVIGGTGRFTDASGSGTIQTNIIITLPSGSSTFTATITGTITY